MDNKKIIELLGIGVAGVAVYWLATKIQSSPNVTNSTGIVSLPSNITLTQNLQNNIQNAAQSGVPTDIIQSAITSAGNGVGTAQTLGDITGLTPTETNKIANSTATTGAISNLQTLTTNATIGASASQVVSAPTSTFTLDSKGQTAIAGITPELASLQQEQAGLQRALSNGDSGASYQYSLVNSQYNSLNAIYQSLQTANSSAAEATALTYLQQWQQSNGISL